MTSLLLQWGTVVGATIGLPAIFGTPQRWWLVFAVEAGTMLVLLAIIPFLHDSPRYYGIQLFFQKLA
jgi:hypothetical protein